MVIDKHQVCIANTSLSHFPSPCVQRISASSDFTLKIPASLFMFYICALGWSLPRKIKAKEEVGRKCHGITLIKFLNVSDGFLLLPVP